MVPSTNLNYGELSNYIVRPILNRDRTELQGFVALQLPILKILKHVRSTDAFLRSADIIVMSDSLNGLLAHDQPTRHKALEEEYICNWVYP